MSACAGRVAEVAGEHAQKVGGLRRRRCGVLRPALDRDVGGPDQGEVALVGVDEDHPLVGVLQQVGVVAVPELAGDEVAALDQAHTSAAVDAHRPPQHLLDPGAGGVDHGPGANLPPAAVAAVLELDPPERPVAARADQGGAGQDLRAAAAGVERVEDDQPGIVDPAVGILEGLAVLGLERPAFRVAVQVQRPRSPAAACARPDGRRGTDPAGRARPGASRARAAARSASARRCAVPPAAAPRARSAPRGPGGTRNTRGSAGRHGPACRCARRSPARGRPARTAAP